MKEWKSDIVTVSKVHWQEKSQGLFSPSKQKVRKKTHTMNTLVGGNGAQWWLTSLARSAPTAAAPPGLWSVPVHAGNVQT